MFVFNDIDMIMILQLLKGQKSEWTKNIKVRKELELKNNQNKVNTRQSFTNRTTVNFDNILSLSTLLFFIH